MGENPVAKEWDFFTDQVRQMLTTARTWIPGADDLLHELDAVEPVGEEALALAGFPQLAPLLRIEWKILLALADRLAALEKSSEAHLAASYEIAHPV